MHLFIQVHFYVISCKFSLLIKKHILDSLCVAYCKTVIADISIYSSLLHH